LQKNKHKHDESVLKKLKQAIQAIKCELVLAYREDDLAFVFIMKDNAIYKSLSSLLSGYHETSGHVYKSIHFSPNK
jgi:hypothetical protein